MNNLLNRLRPLFPYAAIFLLIQLLIRVTLWIHASIELDFHTTELIGAFLIGSYFDVLTACFVLLPVAFILMPMSQKIRQKADAPLRFVCGYVWLFTAVAEYLFWLEFNTRFNFIAVDYLVYTQEVIGNIVESYPLGWLLFAIGIGSIGVTWLSLKFMPSARWMQTTETKRWKRLAGAGYLIALAVVAYVVGNIGQTNFSHNTEANELAGNGIYNLFYAYTNNEISYDQFYKKLSVIEANSEVHKLLEEDEMGDSFISDKPDELTRIIKKSGAEKHKNVIIVVMESMSAMYMGSFGNKDNITPNLDALATQGLFFTNLYATGTRTVRGLEAVTLSVPPTPGQSIVRRTDNSNLFSLGYIFQDRGYDTRFIYGGFGYFDNMNAFFAGNGFDVTDRTDFKKDEIEFANVWGVCDEDLFKQVIRKADEAYAQKKPFMHVVMTTSNHRPYTYPEGRIDIPSKKGGRVGGVKYADYSVGKLVEWAKTKPWFDDTVFVFVADHTAGASGKIELEPKKYHIPMIFYAPKLIKPQTYDRIASQIDLAPVLLGQLNFSYATKFYGEDVLHDPDEIPHAFISSYQKVGLLRDNELTVLAPKQTSEHFSLNGSVLENEKRDAEQLADTIAYYQSASMWREKYRRIPTVVK
jgi:phosphoglycerol transferase MdoB-like AlkP superfamily enzyme